MFFCSHKTQQQISYEPKWPWKMNFGTNMSRCLVFKAIFKKTKCFVEHIYATYSICFIIFNRYSFIISTIIRIILITTSLTMVITTVYSSPALPPSSNPARHQHHYFIVVGVIVVAYVATVIIKFGTSSSSPSLSSLASPSLL